MTGLQANVCLRGRHSVVQPLYLLGQRSGHDPIVESEG